MRPPLVSRGRGIRLADREDLIAATSRSGEVDAFLAPLPEETREALEDLRGVIARAAPDAVEAIGYGVPALAILLGE
jgi:hypothetical protein